MNAIKALPIIFKWAKTLYDIIKQVKANKNQCQRLSKRVESIVVVLKDSSIENYSGTIKEKALQNLVETLEDIVNFVKKFTDASIFDRFFHNTDHQEQFEMFNMQLSHNVADLKLALDITSVFDQHQDMIDRQADLDEISTKLDDIALGMTKQQQELLNHKKEMKNEFKRRFDSFRFHLQQDVLKAQNLTEAKAIDEESKLFLHIPGHDLESEELIGQGGFADVYRGTWLSQHHRVAIKEIRITHLMDDVRQDFLYEISAMCKIRFDHVLNIFGACIEPNYYAIVVEYMSLGSLFNVLQKKQPHLSWPDRWSIALQMTKGVNYLHSMSILHRDIKSLNFLMEKAVDGYLIKICDFGLAKIRQETSRQTADSHQQRVSVGTLQWKAPEVLKFGKPSKASDVYSLGIVFWELATERVPYEELDEATISQGVKAGERLKIPSDVPHDYTSLISNAWSQEPSDRPTSEQLIQQIMIVSTTATEAIVMPRLLPTAFKQYDNSSLITAKSPKKPEAIPVVDSLSKGLEARINECQPCSDVRLNKQQLTDADIEIIVQQAIIGKRCKSLSLALNEITSKGASILADALRSNTTLHELWLSTNHVSDAGVGYLAQALSTNRTLTKLGLASNDITSAGVSHLVEIVKKNKTLNTIGLAMNRIDDQGVQMLANALAQQNTNLEILTLDRNQSVSDFSINALINMIKNNRSLKELWINDCSLSEKGKKKLQQATESKKAFKLVTTYAKPS
ncbi:unnamed protein product [Rotaria socialis]|uniref:Protein kinase domain-containing protein n=1 Tax=Rotaria socialis TaxID=392032 RepID=A0A818AX96_9BILA|nr:unnamed protein product [Rotaria socialis]CAF4411250.1 unnamed protein product [Rotaria socialis]